MTAFLEYATQGSLDWSNLIWKTDSEKILDKYKKHSSKVALYLNYNHLQANQHNSDIIHQNSLHGRCNPYQTYIFKIYTDINLYHFFLFKFLFFANYSSFYFWSFSITLFASSWNYLVSLMKAASSTFDSSTSNDSLSPKISSRTSDPSSEFSFTNLCLILAKDDLSRIFSIFT